MLQSQNLTRENFQAKSRKREIEEQFSGVLSSHLARKPGNNSQSSLVLCGPALTEHYKTHIDNISSQGTLVFIEWDPKVFKIMESQARELKDKQVHLIQGEIFAQIDSGKKPWTYIDFDFCKTFKIIDKELDLKTKIFKLAANQNLSQQGFGMSMTFCQRGDKFHKAQIFLREYVPLAFEMTNWSVTETRIISYSSGMVTSFYFFQKPRLLGGAHIRPEPIHLGQMAGTKLLHLTTQLAA